MSVVYPDTNPAQAKEHLEKSLEDCPARAFSSAIELLHVANDALTPPSAKMTAKARAMANYGYLVTNRVIAEDIQVRLCAMWVLRGRALAHTPA